MYSRLRLLFATLAILPLLHAADPAPANAQNPRAAVTAFLQACRRDDYITAAQYLDLRQLPAKTRDAQGTDLARKLEAVLNSDSSFNVLGLSRDPDGNLADDPDPNREHAARYTENGKSVRLDLQ